MRMKPLDPLPPREGTPQDSLEFKLALMRIERYFPTDKFLKPAIQKILSFHETEGFGWKIFNAIMALTSFMTPKQYEYACAKELAEIESEPVRSEYVEEWVSTLLTYYKMSQQTEEAGQRDRRRLGEFLWPYPNQLWPKDLLRCDLSEGDTGSIVYFFCKNIKAAVDSGPEGLMVLPRNSKGIELRIKKDDEGYYLA